MDNAAETQMEIVISKNVISHRIQELGQEISRDLAGEELVVIGVLKGAFIFMADLIRSLTIPAKIDFVRLKSYGQETESSGQVTITKDVEGEIELRGRNVLVIEDIVDTGLTLDFLKKHLEQHKPKDVRICALIDKLERRERYVDLDYVGFEVAQGYLIGYGLDAAEEYRCLPDIYELKL